MSRFAIRSRRGAYVALVVLTLFWGHNWLVMKYALRYADPISYNITRILVAIAALFAVLVWQRRPLLPTLWLPIAVTGFFQTTLNMGSTTMALAEGGAGRTSVLVFTLPFWTILLAWPVLHERLRAMQWVAVCLALVGITLVVEPWNWQGSLVPKLWAVLSGFGWAAGTVAMKYFLRDKQVDMVNFMTWQMVVGVIPLILGSFAYTLPGTDWTFVYLLTLVFTGVISTAIGFMIWIDVLRWLPTGTASLNLLAVPMVGLIASMLLLGERLVAVEWAGIACIAIGLVLVSLHAWHVSRQGKRDVADPPLMEGG